MNIENSKRGDLKEEGCYSVSGTGKLGGKKNEKGTWVLLIALESKTFQFVLEDALPLIYKRLVAS